MTAPVDFFIETYDNKQRIANLVFISFLLWCELVICSAVAILIKLSLPIARVQTVYTCMFFQEFKVSACFLLNHFHAMETDKKLQILSISFIQFE